MEVKWSCSCHDAQWIEHVNSTRRISVFADLMIDISGQQVALRGDGDNILVEFPSVLMAVRMARELASGSMARSRLAAVSSSLTTIGLTVVVRTPGRRLLTIGKEANSWLLRLFGFRNAQLHVF